jgi:DNA modification methylase
MRDLLNKVTQGDCLEVMRLIPDKSVDMILCDLPYGTTACKWDAVIPFEMLWEHYYRVIKDGGVIALFGSQPFTSELIHSNIDDFRYEWIWEKEAGTGFLSAKKLPLKSHENICIFYKLRKPNNVGLFLSLRSYMQEQKEKSGLSDKDFNALLGSRMAGHYFTNGEQFCIPTAKKYGILQSTGYFQKPYELLKEEFDVENAEFKRRKAEDNFNTYKPQFEKGKAYTCKKGGDSLLWGEGNSDNIVTENDGFRYPKTVLKFTRDKDKLHPTQKPVALAEYLIKTYTNENEVVLDNCIGSGTTAVAAINTNRQFIGIEREPEYVAIANKRIQEALDKN